MGINHSLLKPADNPLYGFGGKGTFPLSNIELPLSLDMTPNTRSEQITFDIVDMVYPYDAIMCKAQKFVSEKNNDINNKCIYVRILGIFL
jgi:hypothetical protein